MCVCGVIRARHATNRAPLGSWVRLLHARELLVDWEGVVREPNEEPYYFFSEMEVNSRKYSAVPTVYPFRFIIPIGLRVGQFE